MLGPYKIVLIGDSGVGKSSLAGFFVHGKPAKYIDSTVGAAFFATEKKFNDQLVKLQIWDTAGQERFRSLAELYYRGSHGAILVFDVSNIESFENLRYWISKYQYATENTPIVVVANKVDIDEDRWAISRQQMKQFSTDLNYSIFFVSAKNGTGITEIFDLLVKDIVQTTNSITIENSIYITDKTSESYCEC